MAATKISVDVLGSVEQMLDKATDLAALPQVVFRVIELTGDPKATSADLEKVLGMDQALATKILTLANSSYYGLPRRVSSLRDAVVFLGFKSVKSLAMTISSFNVFLGKSDAPSLARRAVWRHSLETAQCAQIVSQHLHAHVQETFSPDQAYTCGLLHDVGKMVLDQSKHALFVSITQLSRTHGLRFHDVEVEVMPISHCQLGAAMGTRWNLPPLLCEAIAYHHAPREASLNPRLTATICLANEIAHYMEAAPEQSEDAWASLLARSRDALPPLNLNDDQLPPIAEACRAELNKGMSSLSF
ncbi:MAG: HDOD domain-containing protein [Armatimonadota bacterium]|nr:HDOD domain-containing protein [Armatimonadota bacterium]